MNDLEASYLFNACAAINCNSLQGGVIVDGVPAAEAILKTSNLAPRLNVDSSAVCLAVLKDYRRFEEIYFKLEKGGIIILFGENRAFARWAMAESNIFVDVSEDASAVLNI